MPYVQCPQKQVRTVVLDSFVAYNVILELHAHVVNGVRLLFSF